MDEQPQPRQGMPHPFRDAKPVPAVMASLRVEDVLAARPGWTQQQAHAFLLRHAPTIAEAMLWAGGAAVARLLEAHEYDN